MLLMDAEGGSTKFSLINEIFLCVCGCQNGLTINHLLP